jgi:hypothetical protein
LYTQIKQRLTAGRKRRKKIYLLQFPHQGKDRNMREKYTKPVIEHRSVADPHPACHFDANPGPFCHFDADADADSDLTFHIDEDPDPVPDPSLQIKAQYLEKVLT